jgi:hypothetical protein
MPNEPIRSLLLIDADPAERRRIAAIASRAGWTVVGADGLETAVAICFVALWAGGQGRASR